jgi:hypothetical protein
MSAVWPETKNSWGEMGRGAELEQLSVLSVGCQLDWSTRALWTTEVGGKASHGGHGGNGGGGDEVVGPRQTVGRERLRPNRAARVPSTLRATPRIEDEDEDENDWEGPRRGWKESRPWRIFWTALRRTAGSKPRLRRSFALPDSSVGALKYLGSEPFKLKRRT